MKRFLYNIWILSIVGLLVSCTDDDTLWKDAGGASIKLQFSDGLLLSRAADDTEAERAIKHLDVFIFDEEHTDLIYERINNPATSGNNNEGTVTLKASLSDFEDRSQNYVYVIANATATFDGTESWDDLKAKIQEDLNIHMTGTGVPGMPTHFLMDGIAKNANASTNTSVTINADASDDVTLEVVLERAAAKVEVTLKQGSAYKFLQTAASNDYRGYYFRNMPYKTTLLDMQDPQGNQIYPTEDYLRTPDKANDKQSFNWGTDKVVITGYVYSHKWFSGSLESATGHYYQTGTSLVVNIPLWKNINQTPELDEGDEVYLNSYYQIPIVREESNNTWQIKRNTLYKVEATIEAPGAEDNKKPHTLKNLKYHTEPWVLKDISVGNEMQPKYLEVNKNLLEMHNVATDATLEFTSSSTIKSVTISDAYYYNKYGNEIPITNYNSNGMSTSFDNTVLKGAITINSNVPTNFTARYFTLTVTNEDNETETIKVIQYPVICVSNQLGWYSYREDFKNAAGVVMTFENRYSGGYVGIDADANNGKYVNNKYYFSVDGFFKSKVRRYANNNGTYHTYYYTGNREYASECEDDANVRIYRIDVKATSAEYVVGKPRLVNGETDSSLDNQKLVSPSFMIASRLGLMHQGTSYGLADLQQGGNGGMQYNKSTRQLVVGTISNSWGQNGFVENNNAYNMANDELLKAFKDHCANYVEVIEVPDGESIVYDNWRLPTAAEVQFIIDTQGTGTNNEAIDYLLNGGYYYSACGPIYNSKRDNTSKFVRCVRDVY